MMTMDFDINTMMVLRVLLIVLVNY